MILVTHGVIGGAVASLTGNPAVGFFAAWGSHYIADAVPHWHYRAPNVGRAIDAGTPNARIFFGRDFYSDLFKIGLDALAGYALVLIFFPTPLLHATFAVFGAILPDVLTGIYKMFPARVLVLQHRFHSWMHADLRLDHWVVLGPILQASMIALMIMLFGA